MTAVRFSPGDSVIWTNPTTGKELPAVYKGSHGLWQIIGAASKQRQYLENRALRAFEKGWDAGYDAARAEFRPPSTVEAKP